MENPNADQELLNTEKTSILDAEIKYENENRDCIDRKPNLDLTSTKWENVPIKTEIENEYEDDIKKENNAFVDITRFHVNGTEIQEITTKHETEDPLGDNR